MMNYRDENTSDIETSIHRPLAVVYSINDSRSDTENSLISDNHEIQIRNDHILFVYFDLHVPLNRDLIGSLRAINDDVEIYSNLVDCLNGLRSSNDRIFFISSSIDKELIKEIHDCISVEAIFIFDSDLLIDKSKLPKLFGFYKYSEELLVALKNTLEWFEQTQIEFFVFERDQIFLWYQLWKEEFIKSNISSDKEKLVNMAEKYYRKNKTLLKSLDDFDYCYEKTDVLQWCFSSPFPSRFLRHALSSRNTEYLDLCRFLINDVFRVIQQQQSVDVKTNYQFYKGIKMTKEGLHRLIKHTGKLICPKGFFTCTKSKKSALDLAQSSDYRSDLRSVLFKIISNSTVPFAELSMNDTRGLIVFNVYTAFRVRSVNRGSISIVKIEPADEDGGNLALAYRMKYPSENVQNLLDKLSTLSKSPVELSSSSTTSEVPSLPVLSNEEIHAQRLIQYGTVDQVLTFYKNLKTRSTRILNTMGQLYADKKGDYKSAIKHYKQALKIQEKTGEDTTETLTQLGIAHHNRREFDVALAYHNRALNLHKNNNQSDQALVASSLIGIANAQWGQDNLSEALKNAQEALTLNESIESGNDSNLAMNLAILANIQHKVGNYVQALEYAQRSLNILERCVTSDSLTLASVLNNMGAIQLGLGLFSDAQYSFDRVLKICEKTLPQGHPKRVTMEINIQRIEEIIKNNENNSQLQS